MLGILAADEHLERDSFLMSPMGLAVVWSKGEKLGPVNAQPVALVAPARTLSLDECPEPS